MPSTFRSSSLPRIGLALFATLATLAIGCGPSGGSTDFPIRDFGASDQSMDMSVPTGDLASSDAADLATSPDLAAAPDLAASPDLATPPDLAPLPCDLGSGGDGGAGPTLTLAAISAGALYVTRFTPASGWSPIGASGSSTLADVTIATGSGQPLIAARQSDNALLTAQPALACTPMFQPLAAPFPSASTSARPALAGGATIDLVFKGGINSDQRLYHSTLSGSGFSAPVAQASFLTNLAPAAVREGGALHALFTGTNGKLYDGTVSDGSGGGAAIAIYDNPQNLNPPVIAESSHSPAAVVGLDGTVYVIFTGTDTNLYWTRASAGGSYAAPAQLCAGLTSCLMNSDQGPVATLDQSGAPLVAFHGTDGHLYTSTLTLGMSPIWTATKTATQANEQSDFLPALAPGIGAASAELVYVRKGDGYGRHVRLIAGSWTDGATLSVPFASAPALSETP